MALSSVTGETHWRFQTGRTVRYSPAVADNVVFVGPIESICVRIERDDR